MKSGKVKSLIIVIFGCFCAVSAYSAVSLFSDYGQIQNVQNYSANPFWSPTAPYNQKLPQPVYVQGADVSTDECIKVMQSAVALQCTARNNCKGTSLSDIRPAVIVQLSNLPGKAYSTACIGYLDFVYESYVAQFGNNAPTYRVDFPAPTVPNPALNNTTNTIVPIKNPYETKTPQWKQDIKDRTQELQTLQKQNGVGSEKLVATAFPATYADVPFLDRVENEREGYEPYKNAVAYKDVLRVKNTYEWCENHSGSPECKEYEKNKRAEQERLQEKQQTKNAKNKNETPQTVSQNRLIDKCIERFVKKADMWQDPLFNKTNGVFKDIDANTQITKDLVDSRRATLLSLIGANVKQHCLHDLAAITQQKGKSKISIDHSGNNYIFDFDVDELADYMPIRVGILLAPRTLNKNINDIITEAEMPTDYWWNKDCSDHTIWFNLDDHASVNKAGQAVFKEFGGDEHEYFIDFPVGSGGHRAFPGLILRDKTGSTEDLIIVYNNVKAGLEKIEAFQKALQNSKCSTDGLSAYLVALDASLPIDTSTNAGWYVAAGVDAAWLTAMGLGAAGVGGSTAVGTALAAAAGTGPVGWIIGGVALAGIGIYSIYPSDIADIKQVAVISGPYPIR